jgi:hypothetical protein
MASGRVSVIRAAVVIGIAVIALHTCVAPLGNLAVRDACAREGGIHIVKTDHVDGYWNDGDSFFGQKVDPDCDFCASQVAEGKFAFVDFERTSENDAGPAGMVRFQRGPADSPACGSKHHYDSLPKDQCVTITPLDRSSASVYRYVREAKPRKARFGVEIRELRQTIYDTRSNSVAATYAYFDYATPAEQYGQFAPSYHCQNLRLSQADSNGFLRLVLRAERKPSP